MRIPRWYSDKEPAYQCRRHRRCGFDSWSGRSPGGGHGNPLQYSCLENPMDRATWWANIHRVTESRTRLNSWGYTGQALIQWDCRPYKKAKSQKKKKRRPRATGNVHHRGKAMWGHGEKAAPTRRGEGPREKPTLPAPGSGISSLQNCEK